MKLEEMNEERATVRHAADRSPIKKEQSRSPGQDSLQPVKRRRLRRHDMQGQNVGEACIKSEGLDWHSFWQKVKQEVKEEERSMDAESMKGAKGETGAGFCKAESGRAAKVEHAESGHQAGHDCQPKLQM